MAESKIHRSTYAFVQTASTVQLPSEFTELFVKVTPSASGGNWYRTTVIPKVALKNSLVQYIFGDYGGANGSSRVIIEASTSEVKLKTVYDNGSDVTSNSAMSVYVK